VRRGIPKRDPRGRGWPLRKRGQGPKSRRLAPSLEPWGCQRPTVPWRHCRSPWSHCTARHCYSATSLYGGGAPGVPLRLGACHPLLCSPVLSLVLECRTAVLSCPEACLKCGAAALSCSEAAFQCGVCARPSAGFGPPSQRGAPPGPVLAGSAAPCPPCQSVTLKLCRSAALSLCQSTALSLCHSVALSLCHFVTLSLCHSGTLSMGH